MDAHPIQPQPEVLLADLSWTCAFGRRLVGDAATAEGASQDTWLRALERC